jgi:hypothetical protein
MSRLEFLKLSVTMPIGAVAGYALERTNASVSEGVKAVTHLPTGNASMQHHTQAVCEQSSDPKACVAEGPQITKEQRTKMIGLSPILEELTYRTAPSVALDMYEGLTGGPSLTAFQNAADAPRHTILGSPNRGIPGMLSRRETIAGAVTSVLFGLSHNVTRQGIDRRTIPVTQTLHGGIYWYLQRRLGLASNVAAHTVVDTRALAKVRPH